MYWWDCPCVNRYCYKLPFSGFVPDSLKRAIVKPLRNKASLDSTVLKHVRPVWNLLFESELLKTVVLSQLLVHVVRHSTERTLYQWRLVGHRTLPLHVYYLDYDRRIFLHVAEWRGWPLESFADCFVCSLWCGCWDFRLDVCSVKMADIRLFTPVSICWTYLMLPTLDLQNIDFPFEMLHSCPSTHSDSSHSNRQGKMNRGGKKGGVRQKLKGGRAPLPSVIL